MSRPTVCFPNGPAAELFIADGTVGRPGGSQTQVYLMAKALAARGDLDVRVVADHLPAGARYTGISFRGSKPLIQSGIPVLSRLINHHRLVAPYTDLSGAVLLQTVLYQQTIDTLRIARRTGNKFVYRFSSDVEIDAAVYPPEEATRLLEAVKQADGIIAQTKSQQLRIAAELNVESTVIPNMVELPDAPPTPGGTFVLWVGRGAEIKRPWIMIETARVMPSVQFVMVMPMGEGLAARLFWQSVTDEAKHVPNLRIIPGESHHDMEQHFRNAAVVVSTSAAEGFPNVLLQGAAACTPMISLDVDPDGVLAEAGGYCASGDMAAFRDAIAEYVSDPVTIASKGRDAFAYARRCHAPDVVEPILSAFLRQVLEQ